MKNFLFPILVFLQLSPLTFPAWGRSAVTVGVYETGSSTQQQIKYQNDILYSILSLRFDEADSVLALSVELSPGNPYNYYLQNYLEFLDVLIAGTRKNYETYLANAGKRIESIRKAGRNDPGSLIHLSSIHLQTSFICAYHGENFNAARYFYHARRFLRQSEEKGDGTAMNFRNRGLITMVIGSAPKEYQWMLKVFGMVGEIEEGLGYIEEYHAFSSGSSRLEACLIHKYSTLLFNPSGESINGVRECGIDSLTLSVYAEALEDLASGNSSEVVRNLSNYQQSEQERAFPYLDLLLGEAKLNGLETDAGLPLERFVSDHAGEHYRHYAWHRLGWYYLLIGDSSHYQLARQKVLDSEEAYLDADRQSLNEARDTLPVNSLLLKARLLFDGGYYQKALGQLNDSMGVDLRNRKDSVEYSYRLGRIYDLLENKDKAIVNYKQVLAAGSGEEWYFAPNAALHLGMIYEAEGNPGEALEYYREVLKINRSAYMKSIDYKARQGIRRLDR